MTKPETLPHPSRYFPTLDGLRGIAIIMVIIWHYIPASHSFFPGWSGVDLFFVLSGYLITGRLLDSKGKAGYFSRFYRNRALRIMPLYYALVIPFLLLIPYVKPNHMPSLAIYKQHWLSLLLFLQNWIFMRYGTILDLSLAHLWSLAVEEQFYLIWPLVIFFTATSRLRLSIFIPLILIIPLTRCVYYANHPDNLRALAIYYNTFFRMDSFIFGALFCQLHRSSIKIKTSWVSGAALAGLLTCLTAVIWKSNASPFLPFFTSVGYTILAFSFACMLHLALQPGQLFARICNGSRLRFLGKISYGLYMIHTPFQIVIGNRILVYWLHCWPGHELLINWIMILFCFLLSLFLSVISFRYFESFFLRMKTKEPLKLKIDKGMPAEDAK